MFLHNLKYSLKILFKSKMLLFWTFAFPIILGALFNMAFSNIENSEKLDVIDIAFVENKEFKNNEIFKQTFKVLSSDENKLFNIEYVNEEKANQLLVDDKIVGYLTFEETPIVVVDSNGINETVLKTVTDEISQKINIIENVVDYQIKNNIDYKTIYENAMAITMSDTANIKDISSKKLSYTMIEFYTLIAMTCLYGGMLGMVAINQNLANMSSSGKRISVSPTSKGKLILSSVIASYLTQLIGLALLFIFTIFVLHIDYGSNVGLIILLSLVGSLAGLAIGIFVATIFKTNENTKTGIIISISMLGCFLSGMMGITMKYIVDKSMPIVNQLNPASMITDGFYSLYYYSTYNKYYFDIISLLIFSIVLISISVISLRRQKYDSI